MSLLKCHECGQAVSSDAKNCPGCGAKVRKPVGLLGAIFAASLGLAVFQCTRAPNHIESTPPPAKTAEQLAAERKQAEADNLRYGVAIHLIKTLKQAVRNPASFVLEDVHANEQATVVCIRYRAQNGFGGMNREIATFANGKFPQDEKAWNKYCAHQSLIDLTYSLKGSALLD